MIGARSVGSQAPQVAKVVEEVKEEKGNLIGRRTDATTVGTEAPRETLHLGKAKEVEARA